MAIYCSSHSMLCWLQMKRPGHCLFSHLHLPNSTNDSGTEGSWERTGIPSSFDSGVKPNVRFLQAAVVYQQQTATKYCTADHSSCVFMNNTLCWGYCSVPCFRARKWDHRAMSPFYVCMMPSLYCTQLTNKLSTSFENIFTWFISDALQKSIYNLMLHM